MPAATSRNSLLAVTQTEFDRLRTALESVPAAARLIPDPDADGTTLKGIVGHRAHWITLFLGWYGDGQANKPVTFPAPGYKWNDLKRFNADLRKTQKTLNWNEARSLLARNHADLVSFLEGETDATLYGAPMKGGNNAWTPGRWAEAAGASHYRSAAKYIRARLRAPGQVWNHSKP